MSGPSSSGSSRKAYRNASSNCLTDSRFMPSPPSVLNQRGYYSDIVNNEYQRAADVVFIYFP